MTKKLTPKRKLLDVAFSIIFALSLFAGANTTEANTSTDTDIVLSEVSSTYPISGITATINTSMSNIVNTIDVENADISIVGNSEDESEDTESDQQELWYEVNPIDNVVMYTNSTINVRTKPSTDAGVVGTLSIGQEITITGECVDLNWVQIDYNGIKCYVCTDYIQAEDFQASTYNSSWDGKDLDRYNGKVKGPSGNETFYNLPMERCVYYMQQLGYDYEYWIRNDGVKMYGPYVMVAADLSIRPKGTLVDTTMGTGIVVDTGDFVSYDSTRLDIAVAW